MRRFQLALAFLTVLPVGSPRHPDKRELAGAFLWFPVIGLLIGGVLIGAHQAAALLFPPSVVGAVVVVAWIGITGALHLDGLGDVCDGLYAGRTPEERLRIMKDPHVGAMAVVGITGLILMKFALVSSLTAATVSPALALAPCLGRYGMAALGTLLPYARTEGGVGAAFVQYARMGPLLGATASTLLACGWLGGATGWVIVVPALLALALLGLGFRQTLKGVTGDALGAAGELLEVVVLGAVVWLGTRS